MPIRDWNYTKSLFARVLNFCLLSAYKGLKQLKELKTYEKVQSLLSAYKGLKLIYLRTGMSEECKMFIKCL